MKSSDLSDALISTVIWIVFILFAIALLVFAFGLFTGIAVFFWKIVLLI